MNSPTPRDRFLESLERCATAEGFLSSFYQRFVAESAEIQAKFRHTNFERLEGMLLKSLRLLASATMGEREALRELAERAETHNRYHLDIKPDLYEHWRVALIATAAEFDPDWSHETADAWDRILGHIIRHMTRNY